MTSKSMSWYKRECSDDTRFHCIITRPESIKSLLSENPNFEEVKIVSEQKKVYVLAKTKDGTIYKVNSIQKINETDDNYIINFIVNNSKKIIKTL